MSKYIGSLLVVQIPCKSPLQVTPQVSRLLEDLINDMSRAEHRSTVRSRP